MEWLNNLITKLYNNIPKKEEEIPRSELLKEYYNTKYPLIPISYNGRVLHGSNTRFKVDVRNFFTLNDENLNNIVKSLKLTNLTDNQKALLCLKWVIQHIPYKTDDSNYKLGEYWCMPYETLRKGSGDCFTGETKIIVRDKSGEIKNMSFIELSDCWRYYEALSYDFKDNKSVFKPIVNFLPQGKRAVYEVSTSFGGKFKCTDNHKFFCRDSQKNDDFKWKELKNIDTEKWWKKRVLGIIQSPEGGFKIGDDLACIIGSYIADGWSEKHKRNIAGDDDEIRLRLHKALDNLGIKYSQSKRKVHASTNILKRGTPEEMWDLLGDLGRKGKHKNFPDFVMSADNESIKRILHYYGQRDGTHYNGKVGVYSTVSDKLSEQIKLLLMRLGVHYSDCVQIQNRDDCNRLPIHRIDVRAGGKKHGSHKDSELNTISNYKFCGVEETYDITVEDTHNFVLSGSRIIAHNCEDQGLVLANLLLIAGIPNWKVRVVTGYVFEPVRKMQFGHAYVVMFDEDKEKHVILDTCFYPNFKKLSDREEYKKEKLYQENWFSFNNEFSWANSDSDVRKMEGFK